MRAAPECPGASTASARYLLAPLSTCLPAAAIQRRREDTALPGPCGRMARARSCLLFRPLRVEAATGLSGECHHDFAACHQDACRAVIARPISRFAGGMSFEASLTDGPQTLQPAEDLYAKAVAP